MRRIFPGLAGPVIILMVAIAVSYGDGAPSDPAPEEPVHDRVFQPEPPDIGIVAAEAPTDPRAGQAFIEFISPTGDDEVIEGVETTLAWDARGPIQKVRLYFYYDRTPLGGASRGTFGRIIYGQMLPNLGEVPWMIPWMDTAAFRLRIAGYDGGGNLVAEDEIGLRYRPAELRDLPDHAIAIIRTRQRLYYYKDRRVQRMHIVSTAAPGYVTPRMVPGSRDPRRGEMGRVFGKQRSAFSRMYRVAMPYWLQITSSGSHGIHATSPRYYRYLGRPASHGCVRQHDDDARILFNMVGVGTPVYIF